MFQCENLQFDSLFKYHLKFNMRHESSTGGGGKVGKSQKKVRGEAQKMITITLAI